MERDPVEAPVALPVLQLGLGHRGLERDVPQGRAPPAGRPRRGPGCAGTRAARWPGRWRRWSGTSASSPPTGRAGATAPRRPSRRRGQLLAQLDEVAAGDRHLALGVRLLRRREVRVVRQRRVAAHAEVVLHPALGRQAVVVPAHRVEDLVAAHPLVAGDAVGVRVGEHVPHVQRPGHRRRGRVDRVDLLPRLGPVEPVRVCYTPGLRHRLRLSRAGRAKRRRYGYPRCSTARPCLLPQSLPPARRLPCGSIFEVKRQYPDVVVFFRLGDFYEIFGEDARGPRQGARHHPDAAQKRSAGGEVPMPACPYHAGESYLARLVAAGTASPSASRWRIRAGQGRRPARGGPGGDARHADRRQLPGRRGKLAFLIALGPAADGAGYGRRSSICRPVSSRPPSISARMPGRRCSTSWRRWRPREVIAPAGFVEPAAMIETLRLAAVVTSVEGWTFDAERRGVRCSSRCARRASPGLASRDTRRRSAPRARGRTTCERRRKPTSRTSAPSVPDRRRQPADRPDHAARTSTSSSRWTAAGADCSCTSSIAA